MNIIKKCVSVEQLNEFCETKPKKAERLIEELAENIDFLPLGREEETFAEQLTIGKLIEMIHRVECDIIIESAGKQWYVELGGDLITDSEYLVDALWEMVMMVI